MGAFENQQCLGEWGLPEEAEIAAVNYYYYAHQDIEPIQLFESAADFNHVNFHKIMQQICRTNTELSMLWSKCSFYLVDQLDENALVLVTEERVLDP